MRVATRSRNARSWVMTIAAGCLSSRSSSSVMPSMSRWLVGSSSRSRSGSSANARASAARLRSPPDADAGSQRFVEPEAMQEFDEPRFDAPTVALVVRVLVVGGEIAAQRQALAQRRCRGQLRFLFDQHDTQSIAQLAGSPPSRSARARDDVEQRRLAGAVAADETDALAVVKREVGAVQQGMQAEGEFGRLKRDNRHAWSIAQAGEPGAAGSAQASGMIGSGEPIRVELQRLHGFAQHDHTSRTAIDPVFGEIEQEGTTQPAPPLRDPERNRNALRAPYRRAVAGPAACTLPA